MTTTTTTETISDLFDAWQIERAKLFAMEPANDAEHSAACEAVHAIEDRALALTPATVEDMARQIIMSLDAPAAEEPGDEARLARKARALIGLPVDWCTEDGPLSQFTGAKAAAA